MSFWNDILENKVIDQLYEQAHSIQGTETSNVPLLLFTASNVVRAAAITVSSRAPGGGLAGALTSVWNKVTGAAPSLPAAAAPADNTTNDDVADVVMEEKNNPEDSSLEIIHGANEHYEVVEIEEDDILLSSSHEINKQEGKGGVGLGVDLDVVAEEPPPTASRDATVSILDPGPGPAFAPASVRDASSVMEGESSPSSAVDERYALIPFASSSETHSESRTVPPLPSLNTDLDEELEVDLMNVDRLESFIKSYSPACSRERPHDVMKERRMLRDLIQAITHYYRLAIEELDIGSDHWDVSHVALPEHHDIIGLSKSFRNAAFASPVRKNEEPSRKLDFQQFGDTNGGFPPPSLFGSIFSPNPPPQPSSNSQPTQSPTAVRNLVRCLAVLRAIASTLLGVVRRAELQSPSSSSSSSSRVAPDSKSGSSRAALPSSAVSSLRCWCWLSHEFIHSFLLGAVRESLESSQEGQNVAVYTVLRVVLQTLSWSGKDGVRDSTASILGSYDGNEMIRDSSNLSDGNNGGGNGIGNGGEGSLGWNGPLTKMSLLSWVLRFMLLGPSSMEVVQRCLLLEAEGGEVRGGSVEAEDRIGVLAGESGSRYVGSPESSDRKRVGMSGEGEEVVKQQEEVVVVGTSSIAGSSSLSSGGWGEGELVWQLWDRMGSQSRPLSLSASLLLSCLLQHSPPLLSLSHVYSLPYGLAKTPVSDEVDEEGRGRLGGRMLMGSARGTERAAGFEELLSGMVSLFEKKESVSVDVGIPGMSEGDCAMRRAYAKTACDLLSRVLFHGGDELLSLPSAYFDRYLFGVVGDGSRGVSSSMDVGEGVEDVKDKSFLGRLRRRLQVFAHLRIYEQIVLSDLVQQCMCELSVVMVLGSDKAARRSLELLVDLLEEVKGLLGEVRLAATKQVSDLSGKWSMVDKYLRSEAMKFLSPNHGIDESLSDPSAEGGIGKTPAAASSHLQSNGVCESSTPSSSSGPASVPVLTSGSGKQNTNAAPVKKQTSFLASMTFSPVSKLLTGNLFDNLPDPATLSNSSLKSMAVSTNVVKVDSKDQKRNNLSSSSAVQPNKNGSSYQSLRRRLESEPSHCKAILTTALILKEIVLEIQGYISAVQKLRCFVSTYNDNDNLEQQYGEGSEKIVVLSQSNGEPGITSDAFEQSDYRSDQALIEGMLTALNTKGTMFNSLSSVNHSSVVDRKPLMLADIDGREAQFLLEYKELEAALDAIVAAC